ncbi:hypothetical protein [Rhizobium leguminosarum]|uniref:hypothetical protein n=1 Tax=Rhizobium leguminosarum TaxID=384 RepID=UPI003CFCC93A
MKMAMIIGIVALTAAGIGPVQAQQDRREYRRMNWSENLPEAVRTYHSKRFTIVSYRIADFSETGAHPRAGSAEHVAAIRAAIRSNKWLVAQLKAKKLTPNDIEWVTRARNGNMTFYVE